MARIHDSRGAKTERVVIGVGSTPAQEATFWAALHGSAADVLPAVADDAAAPGDTPPALFLAKAAAGTAEKIASAPLAKAALPAGAVCLLDVGSSLFVWVSRTAPAEDRRLGLQRAHGFLAAEAPGARAAAPAISLVHEGAETELFKAAFASWDPPPTLNFTRASSGIATAVVAEAVDFAALAKQRALVAAAAVTTTSVRAWIARETAVEAVPAERVGEFFSGDSFVVEHCYTERGAGGAAGAAGAAASSAAHTTVYFWLGRHSDKVEQGHAALTAVEKADEAAARAGGGGGRVQQVRVMQGSEPVAFCAAFGGGLLVHAGGKAGAHAGGRAAAPHLYHIKGLAPGDVRAVEVEARAASLNSGDAFVLVPAGGAGGATLWFGGGADKEEHAGARRFAARLAGGGAVTEVAEGAEPEGFWDALGGRAEYARAVPILPADRAARLFEASDASGALRVEEVPHFGQADLLDDSVCLLDAGSELFAWVGRRASDGERAAALGLAARYAAAAAAAGALHADVPVTRVESGAEPAAFTALFAGWDAEAAAEREDPYALQLARLAAQRKADEEKLAAGAAAREARNAAAQQKIEAMRAAAAAAAAAANSAPAAPSAAAAARAARNAEAAAKIEAMRAAAAAAAGSGAGAAPAAGVAAREAKNAEAAAKIEAMRATAAASSGAGAAPAAWHLKHVEKKA